MSTKNPGPTYPNLKPWELEPHYSHHVSAMTGEALHSKAAIAEQLAWRDQTIETTKAALDASSARLLELEQRLARIAELAHDRDNDSHEWRSSRLGQCAGLSWDPVEEALSPDPLKRKSILKWIHLAKRVTALEDKRDALRAAISRAIERSNKSAPSERDNISRNTLVEDLGFALLNDERSEASTR